MRKRLGAVLGAAVVVLAISGTPGAARTQVGYQAVGSIDYIWTGVADRGCAAEGMCGVTGSLQVTADGSSSGGSGQPQVEVNDNSAVARVEYPVARGATARICADPVSYDAIFALVRARGSNASPVGESEPYIGASAGQCAGPTAAELANVRLPVRRESDGGYDLSGTVSLGAGPFQVSVLSHLQARRSRSSSSFSSSPPNSSTGPGRPKTRSALDEEVSVVYRVTAVSGAIVDSFSGLPSPLCEPLGACGASGAVRMQLRASEQTIEFSGDRIVKRRAGLRKALADLHDGRLAVSDDSYDLIMRGEVTGTSTGQGASRCTDTIRYPAIGFYSSTTATADELHLDPNGDAGPVVAGFDPLRTFCPGPGSNTIIGGGSVATGVVRFAQMGARKVNLVLRNRGGFDGPGYSGVRTGGIALTLIRESLTASTLKIRTVVGERLS
jgi:hypothetical protein